MVRSRGGVWRKHVGVGVRTEGWRQRGGGRGGGGVLGALKEFEEFVGLPYCRIEVQKKR